MRKVAVFGNTGGGKSTLARKLAELTSLPLYPLDTIQYRAGGGEVPHDEYLRAHAELLRRDAGIIDGYGCRKSAWERFASADTLVYVDLPLLTHFRWVTKRLLKGIFVTPEGWPEGSPMLSSTINRRLEIPAAGTLPVNRWNIPNRLEQAVLARDTACIYCGIDFSVPVSTRGAKPCPPEDVGGPPGYIEFLEAINDPAHDEHDSMLKWCGGSFEPTSFRLDDTNDRLRQIKL